LAIIAAPEFSAPLLVMVMIFPAGKAAEAVTATASGFGAILQIYGSNLSGAPVTASAVPLTNSLGGPR